MGIGRVESQDLSIPKNRKSDVASVDGTELAFLVHGVFSATDPEDRACPADFCLGIPVLLTIKLNLDLCSSASLHRCFSVAKEQAQHCLSQFHRVHYYALSSTNDGHVCD
jgi:hypothetical protein